MPRLSPDFEVCEHAHATSKPGNSRLYGSILNPVQPADHESHSPFLQKRWSSYREKRESEIPLVLTTIIHRKQDGEPLVYAQCHVRLQGYLSTKEVQRKKKRKNLSIWL